MGRNRSTDLNGRNFAETMIGAVWKKGTEIKTYQNLLKQINKELQELKKVFQARIK